MISWRDRGRGGNSLDGCGTSSTTEGDVSLPLGPGEWEEALGLPLCVVCQNVRFPRSLASAKQLLMIYQSDRMELLERERSWKEDEFDYVLQFLRTILLKRKRCTVRLRNYGKLTNVDGASLIYTIPSVASPLQSLVHSSLGIHSLLKRQPLKHNVIDRDKVVVPPNWDSWGKIRVLREGFDVEAVNKGWSVDIAEIPESTISNGHTEGLTPKDTPRVPGGAVDTYEETIRDPSLDALQATAIEANGLQLEISSLDAQSFLATQLEMLEKLRSESSGLNSGRLAGGRQIPASGLEIVEDGQVDERRVNEHIGPVQFNMGGIQVDADDMLQRLKVRCENK